MGHAATPGLGGLAQCRTGVKDIRSIPAARGGTVRPVIVQAG
jgi:hypothetical protein